VDSKLTRPVRPLSSAAHIQSRTPGLSLDEAQFESAVEHRPWHASGLEGPQAADRRRPHLSHVSLEGPRAPLRAALARRYTLEGPPLELIRREGLNPALIHHRRSK
jgi:hypothetical protein